MGGGLGARTGEFCIEKFLPVLPIEAQPGPLTKPHRILLSPQAFQNFSAFFQQQLPTLAQPLICQLATLPAHLPVHFSPSRSSPSTPQLVRALPCGESLGPLRPGGVGGEGVRLEEICWGLGFLTHVSDVQGCDGKQRPCRCQSRPFHPKSCSHHPRGSSNRA